MLGNVENELDNIFEEKLYVSKRKVLGDATNNKNIPAVMPEKNEVTGVLNLKKENAIIDNRKSIDAKGSIEKNHIEAINGYNRKNINTDVINNCINKNVDLKKIIISNQISHNQDDSNKFYRNTALDSPISPLSNFTLDSSNQHHQNSIINERTNISLPKETSLEGIYDDIELKDVLQTRNQLEISNRRVSFKDDNDDVCFLNKIEESNINEEGYLKYKAEHQTIPGVCIFDIDRNGINNLSDKEQMNIPVQNHINPNDANYQSIISNVFDTISKSKECVNDEFDHVKQLNLQSKDDLDSSLEFNKIPKNYEQLIKDKKIKELEKEFNLIIQTQKDTLKTKSKLYKFVYSEILAMRREFAEKTEELERENLNLKNEVKTMNEKLQRMKDSVSKYNQSVLEKVDIWKKAIKKQVREYLKNEKQEKN